jgi:muconate/chloromuconate cycloisomerase
MSLAPDLSRETAIRNVRARIIEAPTTRQHKLSNTSIRHQGYVFVEVQLDNGVTGYGEGSTLGGPRWAEESVEAMKANIDGYLAPALIGHAASALEQATLLMDRAAKRNFGAKSAIDMALLDGLGKTLNVPAHVLLGGAVRRSFDTVWALASGDAAQEVDEAQAMIERGWFNRFKIKLGFADPATDMARLRALRHALPEHTVLIADVNQGWSEAACIRHMPALAELGVDLVEQPIVAGHREASRRVAARAPMPIMMDESVSTLAEAREETAAATGQVLSLKLCKHGSAHNLRRVAGIAAAAGVELYGGCLLESSIGAAGHLQVFATLPRLEWGTEQFGPKILVEDLVTDSLVYRDFQVHLPDAPGIGVTPDPDIIDKLARTD